MGPKTAGNSHADCPGTNALRGEKTSRNEEEASISST